MVSDFHKESVVEGGGSHPYSKTHGCVMVFVGIHWTPVRFRASPLVERKLMASRFQPPHCDAAVLHAPGECKYCDHAPLAQELRVWWGINFTGHYDEDKVLCPSEMRRDVEKIYLWGGNVPQAE